MSWDFVFMMRATIRPRKIVHDNLFNVWTLQPTVKTQNFGENENEDHADEESGLLGGSSYTSVTDDANGESSSETSETDGQTRTELNESLSEGHGCRH